MKESYSPENPFPVVHRFGYYTAICMSAITLLTFVIAFFTPPYSGPYCLKDCFEYPYPDIAERFPRDYIWMYFAILLNLVFMLLAVSIHRSATGSGKLFSQLGMSFAIPSAGVLIVNYFIQVSVIQPSVLNGETVGIALLTQFNPHGMFIALEEIGFLFMSLSLLFIGLAFAGNSRLEKAIRWILVIAFILTMVSLAWISVTLGVQREYMFEIAVITINWIVLIATGILLAVWFRRNLRSV